MNNHLQLGYFFHHSNYSPPLGYEALTVYLANSHPDRYFDTQAAIFPVDDGDRVRRLYLTHPPVLNRQSFQVVFGRFFVVAHNGDLVQGVSLGGALQIEVHDDHTACSLTSPAPIFALDSSAGQLSLLECKVEAELARLRAEWTGSDVGFDRRLGSLDPLTLFAASLNLLNDYLSNHPQVISPDEVQAEHTAVRRAIRTLKEAGQWPKPVPTLRELMGWSSLPATAQSRRSAPAPAQLALPRRKTARPGQPARQARLAGSDEAQAPSV